MIHSAVFRRTLWVALLLLFANSKCSSQPKKVTLNLQQPESFKSLDKIANNQQVSIHQKNKKPAIGKHVNKSRTARRSSNVKKKIPPSIDSFSFDNRPANFQSHAIALIISSATFHYEITGFVACSLKRLGYTTHLWIAKEATFSRSMIEAGCADEIYDIIHCVGLRNGTRLIKRYRQQMQDISVMVYISGTMDIKRMKMIQSHDHFMNASQRVVMINHISDAVNVYRGVCIPPKCSVIHLADHVTAFARSLVKSNSVNRYYGDVSKATLQNFSKLALETMFPVFDIPVINRTQLDRQFAVKANSIAAGRKLLVAIQGNASPFRRNYNTLFHCVEEIINASMATSGQSNIELRLVGKDVHKLNITKWLNATSRLYDNLSYRDYYPLLASSDLLVSFSSDVFRYHSRRATSTLPTALLCGVPLVMPFAMLKQYPCFWNSSMYRKVAKKTDCDSLKHAVRLLQDTSTGSKSYTRLRQETLYCKNVFYNASLAIFRKVSSPLKK